MAKRRRRATGLPLVLVVVAVALGYGIANGYLPFPWPPTSDSAVEAPAVPDESEAVGSEEQATLVSVIDGDTVETSAGTVRIIGIDTPERGECGHDEAAASVSRVVAPGDTVLLELPPGQNDQDRYGRLLRFVTTPAGVDVGSLQLEAGLAVARYDSRDGYPAHPKEEAYHSGQRAALAADGSVIAVGCG